MTKTSPTLTELFTPLDAQLDDVSSRERRSLGAKMKDALAGAEWVAALPDLTEKIAALLHIDLPGILLQGWRTHDKILDALKRSEAEPGATITLGLVEHDLAAEFHPEIEITVAVAGVPRKFSLPFDLALTCALKGVELKIRNGTIVAIGAGRCTVEGTLAYQKLVLARAPRAGAGEILLDWEWDLTAGPPAAES